MGVLSQNDKTFSYQVDEDIRDCASPAVKSALRQPENLDRWIAALKTVKRNIESQLASEKADRSEQKVKYLENDDYMGWLVYVQGMNRRRANMIRVKNGAENRLQEAQSLKHDNLNKLIDAIREHQKTVLHDEDNSGEADEQLWSLIETGGQYG